MTALLQDFGYIHQDIKFHSAWMGSMTGLKADKLLRNAKTPFSYILRTGETSSDYYVTFKHADGSIRHVPFNITVATDGWYYENTSGRGPYTEATIDDVIYLIMHCEKDECSPYVEMVK